MDTPERERRLAELKELTLAQSAADIRRCVHNHPDLLSRETLEVFGQVIGRLEAQGQFKGARTFRRYYDLLAAARRIGLEQAIADATGGGSAAISTQLRALFEELHALGDAPEQTSKRILLLEKALSLADENTDSKLLAGLYGTLGTNLRDTREGDRGANIERAIVAFQNSLRLLTLETEPVMWAITSNYLAWTYTHRVCGDPEENRKHARQALEDALGMMSGRNGIRILSEDSEKAMRELAVRSPEDLNRAVDAVANVLSTLDAIVQKHGGEVNLAKLQLLLTQEARHAAGADLQAPVGESDRKLVEGAKRLVDYWETSTPEDLFQAIELLQKAAESKPPGSPDRSEALDVLGQAFRGYYLLTGALPALEQAIECHRECTGYPGSDSARAHYLADLSEDLQLRYRATTAAADLEEAIQLSAQAVSLTRPGSDRLPEYLRMHGDHLKDRYAFLGRMADLDKSIQVLRQALALTLPGSRDRMAVLSSIAGALLVRFGRIGDRDDLNESIVHAREGLQLTSDGTSERAALSYAVGRGLERRYGVSGEPGDLEEAILCYRQAISLVPQRSPAKPEMLDALGRALNDRFERIGNGSDLDECVGLWQEAVDLTPPFSSRRAAALNELSVGLRDRYYRTGAVTDLERAIGLSRQSVDLEPPGSPSRPTYLLGLGTGLYQQHERTSDGSVLDEALRCWRDALAGTEEQDPDRREFLGNMGNGFYQRYQERHEAADLDQAIECWQEALRLAPSSAPDRVVYLNNVGGALVHRALDQKDVAALEVPIGILREVAGSRPAGSPRRAGAAGNLGIALGKRYALGGNPADLEEATQWFREAAVAALGGGLESGLKSVLWWADWAFSRRSWAEAIEAFSSAAEILDVLLAGQLLRTGKEDWLSQAQELPSHVAFSLAHEGNLRGAVEFLERGRVRLLAEAQERDRIELERLKATDSSAAYEAYRSAVGAVAQLDRKRRMESDLTEGVILDANLKAAHERVRAASDAIRRVPGYEEFFSSPDFHSIHQTLTRSIPGAEGPGVAVYLAVTRLGGLALMVHAGGVRKLWLDFDEHELAVKLVRRENGRVAGGYLPGQFDLSHLRDALDECLPWLGEKVTGPLLKDLEDILPKPRDASEAPPLLMIPTGRLALLPLHAAIQRDGGASRNVLDECAPTYVLSARSMGHAAAALNAASRGPLSFFGIGNPLPLPQGVPPLAFAAAEVQEIVRRFGSAGQSLCGLQATRAALEGQLGRTTYLHLSCHARFQAERPLDSALLMGNGEEFRLADLLAHPRLRNTRLAVLSACQTAVSDFNALPEEAIGLAAGFQQTGVPGVVGSLWPVYDVSTALLLIQFYEFHLERDPPVPPAQALRRAQRWLRDTTCGELAALFDSYRHAAGPDAEVRREMARSQFRQFALRDPLERPFAHAYYWAPFAFYGV